MANGLGLQEELDFGAGAYYYADIPEFEKYLAWDAFKTSLPLPSLSRHLPGLGILRLQDMGMGGQKEKVVCRSCGKTTELEYASSVNVAPES